MSAGKVQRKVNIFVEGENCKMQKKWKENYENLGLSSFAVLRLNRKGVHPPPQSLNDKNRKFVGKKH